jgi:hypothetical protein
MFGVKSRPTCDGPRRRRVVAGNHDHLNASRPTFTDGIGHAWPERVGKANQPQKFESKFVQ